MAVASIRNFFLIAAFVTAGSLSASAAAPSAKIINEITELVVTSAGMIVLNDDVADARANCEKAQKLARKFDPDSYVAGLIDVCFSRIAEFQKNKSAACGHLDSALKNYAATPATHPARQVLESQIKGAKTRQAKLAC